MNQTSYLSIRMDKAAHNRIQYVAACEGRCVCGKAVYPMRNGIREFEAKYGPITEREICDAAHS